MARKTGGLQRKKASKKSKPRRGARITQGVGILSSIPFQGTPLEAQFISGLGSATLLKRVEDQLGYDPNRLAQGISALNFDTSIGLIVTVGGLITWEAAFKTSGGAIKPYISLIGGRAGTFPNPGTGMFMSAVSLESFRRNPDRLEKLFTKLGVNDPKEVCLLANSKSQMSPTETASWIGQAVTAEVTPNTANPRSVFDKAFSDIEALRPRIRGVIVSADPYFKEKADHLVAAANVWVGAAGPSRFICYPFQEYKDHGPVAGSRVLHGPKLKQAYKKIGTKAKKFLSSPIPTPIEEEPEVIT